MDMGHVRIAIGQAPGEDGAHVFTQHQIEAAAVNFADVTVARGEIALDAGVAHVHLRDKDLEAELVDAADEVAQAAAVVFADPEVRLHADGIDGRAAPLQGLHEAENGVSLLFRVVAVGLDSVIVADQQRVGIGSPRGTKGQIDGTGAEKTQPGGVAQAVRAAIGGMDRLIDDVPGMDSSGVAPGDVADVDGEELRGIIRGDGGGELIGQ